MKELVIASNMIALARNRKGDNKRSTMLRMIMPFLSRETGDKLAQAIADHSSKKFAQMWDHVKHEIQNKLDAGKHHHKATASVIIADCGGITPADCVDTGGIKTTIAFETESTGEKYVITDAQVCLLIKLICERLLMNADPCPLPPGMSNPYNQVEQNLPPMIENRCEKHDWIDCRDCANPIPGFDFNANILELYDRLSTAKTF